MINFWLIPISALIMGSLLGGGAIYEKITVTIPNAEAELIDLQAMTCKEIKTRNAIGSYWLPINGAYARDKVDSCLVSENEHKEFLKKVQREGTHLEKLDVGFEKLWFGQYKHPLFPLAIKPAIITILNHTTTNPELFPKPILVIIGYNNTVKFINQDHYPHLIQDTKSRWSTPKIMPNSTVSMTFDEPGIYHYFSKPWLESTIVVMPFD